MAVAARLLDKTGVDLGAATPAAAAPVQPLTVWVIEKLPAVVTVIDEDVDPLLHNKDPLNDSAVNTELPQLFATVSTGAAGTE